MSQTRQILEHLEAGNAITPIDALSLFGCFRLGARIFQLRELGYNIITKEKVINGKHFAEYSLLTSSTRSVE